MAKTVDRKCKIRSRKTYRRIRGVNPLIFYTSKVVKYTQKINLYLVIKSIYIIKQMTYNITIVKKTTAERQQRKVKIMKKLTKAKKYELEHTIKNLSKHLLKLNPNIKIERIDEKTIKINGHILKLDNYAE